MTLETAILHARVRAQLDRRGPAASKWSHALARLAMPSTPAPTDDDAAALQAFNLLEPDLTGMDRSSAGLRRLLGLHDEQFVKAVYRVVFGREPDLDGFAHYLELLRSGRASKVDILLRFFHSSEGRAIGRPPAWLWARFAVDRLQRLPVIGYLVDLPLTLIRLPSVKRGFDRTDLHQYAQLNRIDHGVAESLRQVAALRQAVSRDGRNKPERSLPGERDDLATAMTRVEERLERVHESIAEIRSGSDAMDAALLARRNRSLQHALEQSGSPRSASEVVEVFLQQHCERLRGDEAMIRERLSVYLPSLEALPNPALPVVDLGSGRGEWLMLLQQSGIDGIGVERNRSFVERCRQRGLSVWHDDIFSRLPKLPDHSARAVSAFHIIEHLELEEQLALLIQARRVLAPGGVLIVETPNPENPSVGSHTFHMDPTHLAPLPARLGELMTRFAGFDRVESWYLNAAVESEGAGSGAAADRAAARDYALLAYKD